MEEKQSQDLDAPQEALHAFQEDIPSERTERPSSFRLALIILTICIASFLCALDQTIVAISVPTITDDFKALGDIAWWTSAYLLTSATLQLTFGRLYSLFPTKHVYVLALVLFSIGSLVCTVAPNSIALILGRAIAGSGAAGIFSGSILVLAASVPLEKRGAPSGLMFGSTGIASITAPFIGGALTDTATWRWCFGINLPIAAIAIGIICFIFDAPKKQSHLSWADKMKRFGIPSMVVITASLVCLVLALQFGGTEYPWSNGRVIALFVLSGTLFLSFIAIHAFMPSQRPFSSTLIHNRGVILAALYSGVAAAAMFVVITYLPLWFQVVKHASALSSGVKFIPLIAAFVVGSAISGGATQGFGYYNPSMFVGMIFSATGGGLLSAISDNTAQSRWIGYEILFGFGAGAAMPAPMLAVQVLLPESEVPMGVSLVNLSQTLWASVFVAIAQSIFINRLTENINDSLPGFDTGALGRSGATQLDSLYSSDQLSKVVPAYSDAITESFYILSSLCCVGFLLSLGMPWKSMKKDTDED